mgnify:CR=1 FL=1
MNAPETADDGATIRDAEATRRRILAAALEEFAEKGIDGARVDRIAERARSNKRMLYHHFGSKEGLYRAVLHQRLAERPALGSEDVAAATRLADVFRTLRASPQYLRLLMWEALERGDAPEAEEVRRDSLRHNVSLVRAERGERIDPADDVDASFVVLAELALAAFPLAFPQLTRMVTGLDPDARKFARDYSGFLASLGEAIDGLTATS